MVSSPSTPLEERELRLAVVMTGGVSLAIWMGGVALELDNLVRAKEGVYAELLRLSGYTPRIDVVSGTSAGGLNGALLAAAVAGGRPLRGLREVWLQAGSFERLMRSPLEANPPSLMKGDDYFLARLLDTFGDQLKGESDPPEHDVDLLVTTTLLQGEDARLVDDFGTLIPDTEHRGLFRFTKADVASTDAAAQLARAARSSASFPVAFEPSLVTAAELDGIADFRGDHYVVDGGVLVNRPLRPALEAIFAQHAGDAEVERVMLYVVPDPGTPARSVPETEPYSLGDVALRTAVTIPRAESIKSDLLMLRAHNRRVADQRSARTLIMETWFGGHRVKPPPHDERAAELAAEGALDVLTRRWPGQLDFKPFDRARLLRELAAAVPEDTPARALQPVEDAAATALAFARGAYAYADRERRKLVGRERTRLHKVLDELRALRRAREASIAAPSGGAFADWALEQGRLLLGPDPGLEPVAARIARATIAVAEVVRDGAIKPVLPLAKGLAPAGARPRECLNRLFALQGYERALGVERPAIPQTIRLMQISGNTRDAFDNPPLRAQDKLAGVRLAHFGAFYKPSWRANDWLWGRLDGSGWLVELLLDPQRVAAHGAGALAAIRRIAVGGPHEGWLERRFAADEDEIKAELRRLGEKPSALPACSRAVARRLQLEILEVELPQIAVAVSLDESLDALSPTGANFQGVWSGGKPGDPDHLVRSLRACAFGSEGFTAEAGSDLLARDAANALATGTSALTGTSSGLPSFITKAKFLRALRGLGLAIYGLVVVALTRSRMAFALTVSALAIGGALLAVAILSPGAQPTAIGVGCALIAGAAVLGWWRAKRRWRHIAVTLLIAAATALVALTPAIVAALIHACPEKKGKPTECTAGHIESFVDGMEPVVVAVALVFGAALIGTRSFQPKRS